VSSWHRDPKNLSQENVSRRLGHKQSWLTKVENAVTGISVAEVFQLATFYETTPADILRPLDREEQHMLEQELNDLRRQRLKHGMTQEWVTEQRRRPKKKKKKK
jgi:transcriptional regulator with XRE-family HTH domain